MLLGLVGKPNSGKSTFFKAATLANVLIAPYPFATIKANHGMGYVRINCIDKELKTQCTPREGFCINHQRFVPVELMDVAGLVPGAHQGKGLGNQFLDDLRQADAFIHILDLSGKTNAEGKPAENYSPSEDLKFLEEELDLWYLGILKKVWKTFARSIEVTHENFGQAVAKQFSGLKVNEEDIKQVVLKTEFNTEKPSSWTDEQLYTFARELRRLTKPMIIAANKVDTEKAAENLSRIKEEFDYPIIPCSADFELALREASKEGLIEYIPGDSSFEVKKVNEKQKLALETIKKKVLDIYDSTGVQEVLNKAVFEILGYLPIFPASPHKLTDSQGRILADCFLLPPGSTALDFAFKLHTDIGKNFVKAIDARTKKAVGKDYKLKFGDALEILTK